MANLLDSFKRTSIGSAGRIVDYTPKIKASGDFNKIFEIDAILISWNNILITPKGSMDHDPEFGSNLYKYIFEPADSTTQQGIENEIRSCLGRYDNRAAISEIKTTFYNNKKGFAVAIIANYFGYRGQMKVSIDEDILNNFQ